MSEECFDEYVSGQWFAPITDRIQAFENDIDFCAEMGAVAEPDSPEWAVNSAMKLLKRYRDCAGLPFGGRFESRHVGAMVGVKASVCAAMAHAHKMAQIPSRGGRQKFVERFGLETIEHAEAVWQQFAERFQPEFEQIRRFAVDLAMRQSFFDDVEFHSGLAKGLTFIGKLRKETHKASSKAQYAAQKRSAVYAFACINCADIETNREDLSWPELSQACEKAIDHEVEIDEDSFKKLLQRCGLRIGKPGRRIALRS